MRAQTPSWIGPTARVLVVYLVVPNLAFLLFSRFAFIVRPLINLDYIALGLLAGFLNRGLLISAFVVLLGADALVTVAPVFHFNMETAAASVAELLKLRYAVVALVAIGLGLGAGCAFLILRVSPSRARWGPPSAALLVVGALAIGVDAAGGTSALQPVLLAALPVNVASSAVLRIGRAIASSVRASQRDLGRVGARPMEAATTVLRGQLAHRDAADSIGATHLVLVVVEALGQPVDPVAAEAVLAPLLSPQLRQRYDVRQGLVAAQGATTNGELRELCGVEADYHQVGSVTTADCLPARLRRLGFETQAFHGFTRAFFERDRWYPMIGFEHMMFAENLAGLSSLRLCGTIFRGVCDAEMAQLVSRALAEARPGRRRFLYWLTLGTHFPMRTGAPDVPFDCAAVPGARDSEVACALMGGLHGVTAAVAAMAMDTRTLPTRFIVVGDHAPPFLTAAERALFLQRQVPFVDLTPRREVEP